MSVPRIPQRPFVLARCPGCDTHGGRTRQAALRLGQPPDAAPALLLRRLPGEAGTEREGGFHPARVLSVCAGGQCANTRLILHDSPPKKAVNFLVVLEWARRNGTPLVLPAGGLLLF